MNIIIPSYLYMFIMNIIQPYIYIYIRCGTPHLLYPFIYRWALQFGSVQLLSRVRLFATP